ncbi:MAG: tetratricopeptide repeat protein [Phycisphaerales bacterium]|nr:tetratricopeptide repeat protein [Phycisphaerales bacterium]
MPSVADLEKLLAAAPGDTFLLYGLAQAHAGNGRHDLALACYDRCLAADPSYCYAYFHKARSLEALARPAEAAATLRAGASAAREAGDLHALAEISSYLDEIAP